MKVLSVDPASPLFGCVWPGYSLKAINGRPVNDGIDFQYKLADDSVRITFGDNGGREIEFDFEGVTAAELGLNLDDGRIRCCDNNCIFCFVHQQPKGMRRELYVKDEDYRFSFTHGNFITLSNTTEADLERIVEQRLSPLYVSVHTTDDTLRRKMLRNKKLPSILKRLRYLTRNGITIHSQVVLCPAINDGEHFEKTVNDLADLFPGISSLAVVPVGLTRFRERLPRLRSFSAGEAAGIIDYIETRQSQFLKDKGSRFIWAADEFYVQADRNFPGQKTYEEMPQFENGVGMAREFITTFNRRRSGLKGLNSKKRLMMLTGQSAFGFLSNAILPYLRDELGLDIELSPVMNRFWGETVTVSGLLTGQDLLRHARRKTPQYDILLIPPNCLNLNGLFLDNLSFKQFEQTLGKPVVTGQYNLAETIKEAAS